MTTEYSTYTYEGGAQETVTLTRGPATPTGHALLKIAYSDGGTSDCYVNTGWLRDRADQLARQRPDGAEGIEAAFGAWERSEYLYAALDEDDLRSLADHIAEEMNR